MKRRIISLALVLMMVLSLAACGSDKEQAQSDASEKPINIRIASSSKTVEFENGGTTAIGTSLNYFVDEIAKRSNGRITATIYPDSQLASGADGYFGGLLNGAFEIGVINNGSWSDYTNAFAGLNIPYLFFSYDVVYATLDSDIGKSWKKKAREDTNVIPLAFFDIGFRQLTNSKRTVSSPSDVKGLKIRTMTDDIQMAAWETLGAAVTPVPYSELYTALQQRLVDGQENPPNNIWTAKLYEEQSFMVITNHNYTVSIPTASPVFWDKLSAEDQQLIQEVMTEAMHVGREKNADFAEEYIEKIIGAGVEVTRLDAAQLKEFQTVAKSMWSKCEKAMGPDSFNELVSFVNEYQD